MVKWHLITNQFCPYTIQMFPFESEMLHLHHIQRGRGDRKTAS